MTPNLNNDGGKAWEPLHPVVSDSSVPGNSASGCLSQVTPGSTAATRMLSPLSGGAVNSSDFRLSPSERAQAVLARASRLDHNNPAQIPAPSNNNSLSEQPSLMPMASLLERCASCWPARFCATLILNLFHNSMHAVLRLPLKLPTRKSDMLPAPSCVARYGHLSPRMCLSMETQSTPSWQRSRQHLLAGMPQQAHRKARARYCTIQPSLQCTARCFPGVFRAERLWELMCRPSMSSRACGTLAERPCPMARV
jgi:hypothetical protein